MQPLRPLPNTLSLAQTLRGSMQDTPRAPLDFTTLFDTELFGFDLAHIPAVLQMYQQLSLPHQPLALVPPEFEVPLPPFELAVYPPQLRDMKKPDLELFDLEQEFASERESLAQITNKCLYLYLYIYVYIYLYIYFLLLLWIIVLFCEYFLLIS